MIPALITLLLLTSVLDQAKTNQLAPPPIETIIIDLNGDKRIDSIVLTSTLTEASLFNGVTISITGFKKQFFFARHGWTAIDSSFTLNNKNGCKSNRIFFSASKDHSTILLFGELDAAGYRSDFSILHIQNNDVKMVFDATEKTPIEVPVSLTDLDKDGKTDFIFTNILEYEDEIDSLNAHLGYYSPFYVYTIGEGFDLNKTLTKQYNERNYVFAGYEADEKIKVIYPRNGSRPKIFKAK